MNTLQYDFSKILSKFNSLKSLPDNKLSELLKQIETQLLLENTEKSFHAYLNEENENKYFDDCVTLFTNYRDRICINTNCLYKKYSSYECTACLLMFHSIFPAYYDNNFFYYNTTTYQIYLTKNDFSLLTNLFQPRLICSTEITNPNKDPKAPKLLWANTKNSQSTFIIPNYSPTLAELSALISIHHKFLASTNNLKNATDKVLLFPFYQVISYYLCKKLFALCKIGSIVNSFTTWDEALTTAPNEFKKFLFQQFLSPLFSF